MKPDTTEAMVRREFLKAAAGAAVIAGAEEREAREVVRSGELGQVTFCRVVDPGGRREQMLGFVQDVLGAREPVSMAEQGTRATLRYPRFVTSYERAGGSESGVWFYGSEGTLCVSGNGLRIWSDNGRFIRK